jgi:ribose transport system permease protein
MQAALSQERPGMPARLLRRISDQPLWALGIVLVILYSVTGVQDPAMWSMNGVRSVLLLACPLGLFAAAQTLCMLTGGIDMSLAMTANLAAYLAASRSGLGAVAALAIALGVGLLVGLVNGLGVAYFGVNPIIMTLGMASVLLGVVSIGLVGDGFLAGAANILPFVEAVGGGSFLGPIPMNALVWLPVSIVLIWGLARTGIGRSVYAVGDNVAACELSGVRVKLVTTLVYIAAGLLAAVGGILFSGMSGSIGPDQTNAYLLPAIAATVIGGTSILGGIGGYAGTIVGALILTVLNRLLLTFDTDDATRQVVYGLIVLALAWAYVRMANQKESIG